MQKAEAQHNHAQQPTQRHGKAIDPPQGEQYAQLEAMIDASPQVSQMKQLAAMMDSSPKLAAQRKAANAIHNSPHLAVQRQRIDSLTAETAQREEAEEPLQAKATQREEAPAKPNDTGLPDNLKSGIESLSGMSMDNVRVHYNSSQPAQLNALAYAQGTDIHVAPGQEQHLPHEAWHVVQQAQGRVQPTMQMKGAAINDDAGLEAEADAMGGKAAVAQMAGQKARYEPVVRGTGSVIQRIAWHNKNAGSAITQDDTIVPAINGVKDTGATTTINVSGLAFTGPMYELDESTGADKTEVVTVIASALGGVNHPQSGRFLKKSQLTTIGVNQTLAPTAIPGAIVNVGHQGIYKGAIDPYIIRAPGKIDGGGKIALHYQFGVDSYGYVVKIEQEGKVHEMHGERGQDALLDEQVSKLKKGSIDDPLFEKFSSAHDTDSPDESISEVASKSTKSSELVIYSKNKNQSQDSNINALKEKSKRLDAVTKIGGEGARWVCVREHAKSGKLANSSRFYTRCPDDHKAFIGITFQNLWGCWSSLFESKFNIPDDEVVDVIEGQYAEDNEMIVKMKYKDLTASDYCLD